LFSPETAGVLDATLLGNKHNISLNAAERFRDGGTFHVLVISGLQIAFIGGLALYAVRAFTKRRGLQSLCAGVFLWGYTVAVGADLSVVRSAFMFTIVVLAPVVSRRSSTLNNLGGAALALLIWRPNDLFDPSFQLTFLSVLSIVTIAVPILTRMREVGSWRPTHGTPYPPQASLWFRSLSEALFWSERQWRTEMAGSNISYRLFKTPWAARLERWRLQPILRFAIGAVVVSAGVQIGLLPLLILYFHRVSLASLLLNIVVGLLMALLALLSLAATLISVLSYRLALPFASIAEKTNWLMIHLVDPFSRLGIASFRMPHYRGWPAAVYALYFVLLGFLVLALRRWQPLRLNLAANERGKVFTQRNVTTVSVCFLAVLMLVVHPVSGSRADGELHVDFLDVGQGDAALLTMPDGTTLMIDGGGRPNTDWNKSDLSDVEEPFQRDSRSVGEQVVSEYLWAKGLDRVDYILATHADADHIDGLSDVARNFKVRAAIVGRTPAGDPGYRRFAETMQQAGVPVERIGAGDVLRFGEVSAQVLWPPPRNDFTAGSRNNDSVVLRVGYGEKTFLFTGDVEKEAEHEMVSAGVDLAAQIVKVAHHGSRTSSTEPFVAAAKPAMAIVSVGRTSIFGHPNKEVVERWRAVGAQVLTTGESGTISVVTDGRQLKLSTFVPR
jgi:competence protein ComEC